MRVRGVRRARGVDVGFPEDPPPTGKQGNNDCFLCYENAEDLEFGGRRRRYRDAWNRTITRNVAKNHAHSLKIKAVS